ncbi:CsbD family protein [Bacillus aerolatus]|uniref:CsbD family protein n=1 Tax=Bacillus aerolatus TaxID=2653354 RepID=A0A6I1FP94_9BACI|nr:CsbD family protein [Bacillus aerolatus]KAB7709137.1 CsbD family protein [Bacillus aerolatus]
MKDSGMADKLKGMGNKVMGEAKEAWGNMTNNDRTKAEGKADQLKGKFQDAVGKAKNKLNDR